jgi:hypothetical protein
MKDVFNCLIKLLALIGTSCLSFGGYLCHLDNSNWSSFLVSGMIVILTTIIWCANTEEKVNEVCKNSLGREKTRSSM